MTITATYTKNPTDPSGTASILWNGCLYSGESCGDSIQSATVDLATAGLGSGLAGASSRVATAAGYSSATGSAVKDFVKLTSTAADAGGIIQEIFGA